MILHPFAERLPDYGVDDVAHPLFGDFVDFPLIGQVLEDVRVVLQEAADLGEGELLILGHLDPGHLVPLDVYKG